MAAPTPKNFSATDGALLSYYDIGPENGPCVVLVSGYGAPAASWCMQWEPLLALGCRVVSFDRRGHGLSPQTGCGHSLACHSEDLHELIQHIAAQNPVLIGQSMGASTIFAYIAAHGDKDIRGFVSIDQTPKMVNESEWTQGMRGLTPETLATFFDSPIPDPLFVEPSVETQLALAEAMAGLPEFDMLGTKPLLLDHAASDWRETLAGTTVPALFVAGENSPFWPSTHAAISAGLCSKGEAIVVENCGHAVNWEQVAACNDALQSFVQKVL